MSAGWIQTGPFFVLCIIIRPGLLLSLLELHKMRKFTSWADLWSQPTMNAWRAWASRQSQNAPSPLWNCSLFSSLAVLLHTLFQNLPLKELQLTDHFWPWVLPVRWKSLLLLTDVLFGFSCNIPWAQLRISFSHRWNYGQNLWNQGELSVLSGLLPSSL